MNYLDKKNRPWLLIIVLSEILFTIKSVYGGPYNQDIYPYIEGGWLITKGYIPYIDFYIPTGPVTYFLHGIFTLALGANIGAVYLHLLFYALTLSIFSFYVFSKLSPLWLSALLAISLPISTNLILGTVFYTSTAIFFVALNILIIVNQEITGSDKNKILWYSILLLALSIFSKHDVGLLHAAFLTSYFFFDKKQKISNFKYLILIIPAVVFTLVIFKNTIFLPTEEINRTRHILKIIISQKFLLSWQMLAIICSFIAIKLVKKNNNNLYYIFIFISIFTMIISKTSGYGEQSEKAMIPILAFILYIIFKRDIKVEGRVILPSIIAITIIASLRLVPYSMDAARQFYYLKIQDHPTIARLNIITLKNHKVSNENFNSINNVYEILAKAKSFAIVGIGDYQFFYPLLMQLPPKKTPLWYHLGVTVDENREPDLLKNYLKENPELILVSDESKIAFNFFLNNSYSSIGKYKLFGARSCNNCYMHILQRSMGGPN